MKNLWWAYTTCTVIHMQELRGEEGGGLIIHGVRIIRTLRYNCVDFLGTANHIAMANMVIFIAP